MQRSADRTSPAAEVTFVMLTAFGSPVPTSIVANGRYAARSVLDAVGLAGRR